jgi:hypothetical protein
MPVADGADGAAAAVKGGFRALPAPPATATPAVIPALPPGLNVFRLGETAPVPEDYVKQTEPDAIANVLNKAMINQMHAEIEYRSKSQGRISVRTRLIDVDELAPDRVFCYDHLTESERDFRLDRILWARLSDQQFENEL